MGVEALLVLHWEQVMEPGVIELLLALACPLVCPLACDQALVQVLERLLFRLSQVPGCSHQLLRWAACWS